MTWRCAWCPPDPKDEGLEITHGICEKHLEVLRTEIAARRAAQDVVSGCGGG